MTFALTDARQLVEQLANSLVKPAIRLPGNAELIALINQLGTATGEKALQAELLQTLHAFPVRLSTAFAENLMRLLVIAEKRADADPAFKRAVEYVPNQLPLKERLTHFVLGVTLFAYGVISIRADDFYLPGKRGRGFHLHGLAAWVAAAAVAVAAAVLILAIIDHYDRRDNEHDYVKALNVLKPVGWTLLGLAVVMELAVNIFHLVPR